MTGPNPILTNGRLTIFYTTDEPLTHKCNLDVNVAFSGGVWNLVAFGGGLYGPGTATDEFLNKIKPFHSAATNYTQAILYERVAGVYQARLTIAPTVTVGTGVTGQKANQNTFTFRDKGYFLDKIVLFGTNTAAPFEESLPAAGGNIGAFYASLITISAGNIGWWYRSKDNQALDVGLKVVACLNKKSRRRLALI